MSLTSVNPDNVNQNANTTASDNRLMKQPPTNPVPNYDGIMPQQALNIAQQAATTAATGKLAQATQQGDQSIANAKSSSGGGSSPLGGIFGAVGSILGSLFAQGGFVGDKANGYARGGEVDDQADNQVDNRVNDLLSVLPTQNPTIDPPAPSITGRDTSSGPGYMAPDAQVSSNDPPASLPTQNPTIDPPAPSIMGRDTSSGPGYMAPDAHLGQQVSNNDPPAPDAHLGQQVPSLPGNQSPDAHPSSISDTANQQQRPQTFNDNPSSNTDAHLAYLQQSPNPSGNSGGQGPSPFPSPEGGTNAMDFADYTGLGPNWVAPTFARGGEVNSQAGGGTTGNPLHHALAAGYLTGALHQAKFGGTPETLGQAAAIIKKMMGGNDSNDTGSAHMADGGMAPAPSNTPVNNIAQQSLMDALGLSGGKQSAQPQMGNPAEVPQTISGGNMQQPGMADGGPATNRSAMSNAFTITGEQMRDKREGGVQPMLSQLNQNVDTTQQLRKELELKGLKGFAIGGPGIGPQAQPNDPDNDGDFEGEVKGPGGPTDDAIPARLSNGEFVMSAASTAFFGVDKLNKMNEQGKQGFMQAKAQVDQNQSPQGQPQGMPQGGQGSPVMSAQAAPPMGMMQPPMQQAKGGPAIMKTKGSGYMGL